MKKPIKKSVPSTKFASVDKNWKSEKGKVKTFSEEPAFVSYKEGIVINLGNYQSARFDVGITMPCLPKDVAKTLKEVEKQVKNEVIRLGKEYETPIA